jgi:predicted dehydrogenase
LKLETAVVGVGNIGFRYIQGIVQAGLNVQLTAFDSSPQALNFAKSVLLESDLASHVNRIDWRHEVSDLSPRANLVIVATTAAYRADLVEELSRRVNPEYWIIEKVLAQSLPDLNRIQEACANARGCWVNTPRRAMKWYRGIKTALDGRKVVNVRKSGGLWGLACNAIHFIDLVSFLTDEILVSIDSTALDSIWLPSKRGPDFFEVSGKLVAHYSGAAELYLSSEPSMDKDTLEFQCSDGTSFMIDEQEGVVRGSLDLPSGKLELQSEMTPSLVTEILHYGSCGLPTLRESVSQHAIFIDAMIKHWNKTHYTSSLSVPIT